jgi:short-subunit dehydrogenase involved in D-alanine esterification of teichoic acids
VIEIIPPRVSTELGSPGKTAPIPPGGNRPMPLDAFIAETMRELESGAEELAIADARRLAAAACSETARQVFARMNP